MKFKNVKEKIKFINNLEEMDNQAINKYINIISLLAHDKNIDVRMALAKQLVLFDNDEIENILYDMLSDKNRMVRLEAIDSLSSGRHYETIEKVGGMLKTEGYLIRMYAVSTLFDLITNAYGVNEKAFEKYNQIIKQSYQTEINSRVLLSYYQNEYYMQPEKGLFLLKTIYVDALENEKYDLIWTILHIFKEIKNKNNYKDILQIVKHKNEKLLPAQKVFVDTIRTEKVSCKILILDEDNSFLSHVVAVLLCSMCNKEDVMIETAGMDVGVVCLDDIRLFCERNNILCPGELYSKRITEAYAYDYIVCLNTMLNSDMYFKIETLKYANINAADDKQLISLCEDIKAQLLQEFLPVH